MPVQLRWYNDSKQLVMMTFDGDWDLTAYLQAAHEAQDMMRSVPHTVHMISDFTHSARFPTQALSAASQVQKGMPSNQGIVVAVKMPYYLTALAGIAQRIYPKITQNLFYTDTVEAAIALIDEKLKT